MPESPLEPEGVTMPSPGDSDLVEVESPPPQNSRKRGRPKVVEESIRVSTWLPVPTVDKLIRVAQTNDESISQLVRSLLMLRFKD